MTLVEKQNLHATRVALLIQFAQLKGYLVTGGDWYRDKRCPYGAQRSAHHKRLATDLLLHLPVEAEDGTVKYKYLRASKDYAFLGRFWERLGGKWGVIKDGRQVDGNHFETV